MANLLSNYLTSLKLLPSNAGKLDMGISSTGIPYTKLTSLGGTAYYVFVTNDGRLQVHTSEPTTNTDGVSVSVTAVGTTQLMPLGTRITDTNGNEFIYMKGVSGVTATSNWVSFDEDHVTTLLAANAVGRVAVAMGVCDANTKFGWFQIYGKCAVAATDAVAVDKQVYIDATAGRVDDGAVTGDIVIGAITRSTDSSTNIATVELNYPMVSDVLG